MTSTEFERLLSARPKFTGPTGHKQEASCLRDMVFDYFCERYPGDMKQANEATKEYTDYLYTTVRPKPY